MAEWLILAAGLVVVLKFFWDHLIAPVMNDVLNVVMFLRNQASPGEGDQLADPIGFVHFGDPDEDDEEFYDE